MGFADAWAKETARHEQRYEAIRGEVRQAPPFDGDAGNSVNSVNSVHRDSSPRHLAQGGLRKHNSAVGNGICGRTKRSSFYSQGLGPGCDRSRKKVTPDLLHTYKAARAWLDERIGALLDAGWTRTALFRVGKRAYPYEWGAAWSFLWTSPEATPELTDTGEIVWTIKGTNHNSLQVMRPEAYRRGR